MECCNAAEQHGYGMGADELAVNEMIKDLTELANALRQSQAANGATGQTESTSALEQIKNSMVNVQQQLLATQQVQRQMVASMQT